MSGGERRAGAPQGPPWSPDLLADLHAGVLDEQTASELRTLLRDDAEANAVLAALDATASDLAGLPDPAIPEDVAARLDTALEGEVRARQQNSGHTGAPAAPPAAEHTAPASTATGNGSQEGGPRESGGAAPVVDLAAARRRRRFATGAGLIAAAAAVTGVVVFSSLPSGSDEQAAAPPQAEPPAQEAPLALRDARLDPQQFQEVLNSDQLGALSDPGKLIGCLQANGVSSGNPMGSRQVTIGGKPGQMLVLATGEIGEFRLLTVGPECGPGNPATIADSTFGG